MAALGTWLRQNSLENPEAIYLAAASADLAGDWNDARSFYRKLLGGQRLDARLAAKAVPAGRFFVENRMATGVMERKSVPEFRCEECLRGPDKTRFQYDKDNHPFTVCMECVEAKKKATRIAKQDAVKDRDVTQLLRMAMRKQVHLPALSDLAFQVAQKFGGMEAVVDIIYVKLDKMLNSDRIDPRVQLDALKYLTGLLKAGMASVTTQFDASMLTDEELDAAMRDYVEEIFGSTFKHPALPEQPQCQP